MDIQYFAAINLITNNQIIHQPNMYQQSTLQRQPSYTNMRGRSRSPNKYAPNPNNRSHNNSVHSQHLWNMIEDIELFPEEIHGLLKNEERNLSAYKVAINREKDKVTHEIENLKRQIVHNIDDLKISIHAQLNRIYMCYMEKYATMKGEIMEIKKMKDEVQIDISRRNRGLTSVYSNNNKMESNYQNIDGIKSQNKLTTNNQHIMKSMEQGMFEMKKYQMLNYIAELQKEKIIPLGDLVRELVILTKYENGYYQNKQFSNICTFMLNDFKNNLKNVHEKKYQFIRDPELLVQKEDQHVLDGLYEEVPVTYKETSVPVAYKEIPVAYKEIPVTYKEIPRKPTSAIKVAQGVQQADELKNIKLSHSQQILGMDWVEDVRVFEHNVMKIDSEDIILCALQINKNTIAVGNKSGIISVYDCTNGHKIVNLKGHRASICTLSMVQSYGKQYLGSGSDHGCNCVILWDISSWSLALKLEGHKAAVTSIVDLQDNQSLISGSYDKKLNVYNMTTGKLIYNLPTNKSSVTAIILNSTGSKMVSCGLDNTLNIWQVIRTTNHQVETMFLERIIQNNTMICSLVGSIFKENVVYIGTKDGKIKLLDIEKGQAYKTINACNNAVIEMVILERQSKTDLPLVMCWPCKEECMKIVNTESGKVNSVPTKGYIEFGCGIGPKGFVFKNAKFLGMLSQSQEHKNINIFRIETIN